MIPHMDPPWTGLDLDRVGSPDAAGKTPVHDKSCHSAYLAQGAPLGKVPSAHRPGRLAGVGDPLAPVDLAGELERLGEAALLRGAIGAALGRHLEEQLGGLTSISEVLELVERAHA